jgi:hypothetical protein
MLTEKNDAQSQNVEPIVVSIEKKNYVTYASLRDFRAKLFLKLLCL